MPDTSNDVITVEIQGQQYPIRSNLDTNYVTELAHYVDEKMSAAAYRTNGGDSVRVAVLAALNIADEFFRNKADFTTGKNPGDDVKSLAIELENLVDSALRPTST